MRVAVITPYYRERPEFLKQCHDSVAAQSHPCLHVMVADGDPLAELDDWDIDHVKLPQCHADIGSTPRLIGSFHAIGLGVDAVAFLDADNWYRPDHVASMLEMQRATGAGFISSGRMLCRIDGSLLMPCPTTDPECFIDTSCMMLMGAAFPVLANWSLMPSYAHVIGDRVMLQYIKQSGAKRAHSPEPTVFYRCGKDGPYRYLGEPVPPGVVPPPDYGAAVARWIADGHPPLG
jgi:glycosyltransferase involved in cell wall biosynthesis